MLDRILIGSSAEPSDPNFKNVTLLLHGDGSNGAQNNTFIDSSTNNFTITRNGNTTQGSFSPYGSNWSNYFDGSGDYLQTSGANLAFGSGSWTVEGWIFLNAYPGSYAQIFDTRFDSHGSTAGLTLYVNSTGSLRVYQGTDRAYTSSTISLGTWTHFAAVYDGTTLKLYLNGSNTGATNYTASLNLTNTTMQIGAEWTTTGGFINAYISNFRVVKGTAVYTANFSVPTAPLTAITNTSLLTCADNRFRDGSTNNFTITRNGDVKVTNFAPFAPSSAYSTATNGGSAYFDGSGDYLQMPSSAAFAFGTGDYTIEGWFYPTVGGIDQRITWFSDDRHNIDLNSSNQIFLYDGTIRTFGTAVIGSWNHFAVSRSGGTVSCYLNGVRGYNASETTNSTTRSMNLGSNNAPNGLWNGFMSNVRVVKGTAVYSGTTITVPTSPVTAITNTQLLVNATNAAIFDNSMKNDLETVGNAQISTSVKKFGTGSMYFDGNGDYLAIPFSDQMKFGTGDFTIEFWIYPTADSGDWFPVSSIGNLGFFFGRRSSGGWGYGITGSAWEYSSGTNPTLNTWQHVAISRSGTSIRIFVNGTQVGTTQTSGSDYSLATGGTSIGSQGANYYVTGYMDEVRITKGVARYTANFTAPTAPFPNK